LMPSWSWKERGVCWPFRSWSALEFEPAQLQSEDTRLVWYVHF
jgi:hypothetical protein